MGDEEDGDNLEHMIVNMENKNYVIACYSYDSDHQYKNRLNCYTYGSQVQYGNEGDAERFLEYVKGESPDKDWQIFWLNTDMDDDSRTPKAALRRLEERTALMEKMKKEDYFRWLEIMNDR